MKRTLIVTTLVALVALSSARAARAATIPVTGWMVHNGTSTVGGTTSAPTFTPGDNATLMAPFTDVTLSNDGDFVEATTTLVMNSRTTTGINSLNTQLRFALLDNSASGSLGASDFPNVGYTIEYSNLAAGGLIREQTSTTQTNPFTTPANIGNGTPDSGADSLRGANPGAVTFDIKLTRNAGKLDLVGSISGTDSTTSNPYLANFTASGLSSANFPTNGAFTFNRVALFLGDSVDAASASLSNSVVTTNVPEPASCMFAAVLAGLGIMKVRRPRS
jgi:hypothetical protein